jgi:hypothetical protein
MLYPKVSRQSDNKPEPDFNYIHRELRKHKSVTLMLLWQEYRVQHGNGLMYSQFCDRYCRWRQKVDVCMRQFHRAGEKMFVDWAISGFHTGSHCSVRIYGGGSRRCSNAPKAQQMNQIYCGVEINHEPFF